MSNQSTGSTAGAEFLKLKCIKLLSPLPVYANTPSASPENNLSYWRPAAENSPPNNETQHGWSTFFQNPSLPLHRKGVCVCSGFDRGLFEP